uniref:Uncharacterized protein n=1 Tax=Ditylenchus dipsaci TaxID=166011 RepID=A0A915EQ09_9BILA
MMDAIRGKSFGIFWRYYDSNDFKDLKRFIRYTYLNFYDVLPRVANLQLIKTMWHGQHLNIRFNKFWPPQELERLLANLANESNHLTTLKIECPAYVFRPH